MKAISQLWPHVRKQFYVFKCEICEPFYCYKAMKVPIPPKQVQLGFDLLFVLKERFIL